MVILGNVVLGTVVLGMVVLGMVGVPKIFIITEIETIFQNNVFFRPLLLV
jgi:hypothetical protein